MVLKKLLSALSIAGLFAVAGPASAAISFSFNPNGTGAVGAITDLGLLDQSPGNTLAVGAVNTTTAGAPKEVGSIIEDLFQANLGSLVDSGGNAVWLNGTGGKFFTFVASFTERVATATVGIDGSSSNTFTILSGSFKMCAQTALGNNLAGTGFGCAGPGILSGNIFSGTASITAFPSQLVNLDQSSNGNQWPGVQTISSNGGADINASLGFVDANYFPDLNVGSLIAVALTNTSLITPYSQVDPSRRFSNDGVTDTTPADIGAINGISGPNIMFQSDANTAFQQQIPEPGSLALAGLALAGLSMIRRRRQ